jgi:hypothetical protein
MSRHLNGRGCPQVHRRDLSRNPTACGPCGQPAPLITNTVASFSAPSLASSLSSRMPGWPGVGHFSVSKGASSMYRNHVASRPLIYCFRGDARAIIRAGLTIGLYQCGNMAEQIHDDRSLLEGLDLSFAKPVLPCEALRALWLSLKFIERTWREMRAIVESEGPRQKLGHPRRCSFPRVSADCGVLRQARSCFLATPRRTDRETLERAGADSLATAQNEKADGDTGGALLSDLAFVAHKAALCSAVAAIRARRVK